VKAAEDELISALHVLIDEPVAGPHLFEILAKFQKEPLVRVRVETERLLRIYDKARPDDAAMIERLKSVLSKLPPPDSIERIRTLAQIQRWEMEDGELQAQLDKLVAVLSVDQVDVVTGLLNQELPAAWEIGHALAGRPLAEGPSSGCRQSLRSQPCSRSGISRKTGRVGG